MKGGGGGNHIDKQKRNYVFQNRENSNSIHISSKCSCLSLPFLSASQKKGEAQLPVTPPFHT